VLEEPGVEESEPGEALAAYGVIEAG
jgi:hypothetical protein